MLTPEFKSGSTETHKVKFAKQLLFEWLCNCENENGYCPDLSFGWRNPNYGVHLNLPFYSSSDSYYFECSGGLIEDKTPYYKSSVDEIFDPAYDRGELLFIPDITIFHKGQAQIFIYVCKGHLSPFIVFPILELLEGHWVEIYQIHPDSILDHAPGNERLQFTEVYHGTAELAKV